MDSKKGRARPTTPQWANYGLMPSTSPGRLDASSDVNPTLARRDLASRWISGELVADANGHVSRRRLSAVKDRESGTSPDDEGRAALAELLLETYRHDETIGILATLIAPEGHPLADDEFQISIERRRKGAPENVEIARAVGLFVWEQVNDGSKTEAAIASAQASFGLERRQVQKHWRTFNERWRGAYEAFRNASDE